MLYTDIRFLASRSGFYIRDLPFLRRSIFTAIKGFNLNYIFRCKEEKIWYQIFLILDRLPPKIIDFHLPHSSLQI